MINDTTSDPPRRTFFGHPRGLSTLFFTEMWERFSYFGMRAILALYLATAVSEGGLGLSESTAESTVAAYGASVYLTGVAGGWLADRLLGSRRSIFYGGLIIMFGHTFMAIPGGAATVFIGVVLIITGSGLMKPNISKVVGNLYSAEDIRRDAGFSIFYMSINIGSFVGQIITALLADRVNFHVGFGAAAVGMALGLIQYLVTNKRNLGETASAPDNPLPATHKGRVLARAVGIAVAFVVVLGGLRMTGSLDLEGLGNLVTIIAMVLPVVYFSVMLSSKQITTIERDRLIAYIPLFLATALFFMLFEQQSTTLVFVAKNQTTGSLFGFDIPVGWYQSVNPLAIIIMAPMFAALWMRLGNRQPSTPMKFVGGLFFVGLAFLWVVLSGWLTDANGKINPLMLALVFVIMTVGELMLSPVGVSATTKLAPKAFASQTLGLYFLAPALGQGLGVQIVKLQTEQNQDLYFGVIGLGTIACGVLLALGRKTIKDYMHGVP